jgi:hypothetical protein
VDTVERSVSCAVGTKWADSAPLERLLTLCAQNQAV